jgi:cytoskeletal protein CcmA (bactofilin family)
MWARRNSFKAKPNVHDAELSLLGKNARFKGDIMFEGTARIDGRLHGDISTEGILVIGEEAVIEGNIIAGTVICVGGITGDIVASERVELIAPAVFKGRVKTPRLSLQEGVSFLGASEVQSPGITAPGEASQVEVMASGPTAALSAQRPFLGKRLIPTAESGAA